MNVKIIDAEWEEIPPHKTIKKDPWYIKFLYQTGLIMANGLMLVGISLFIGRVLGLLIYGR